jgi:Asp-tRNA(Asn)/Glu-tRNA(Gln) amidotransferase A subunit family amidase
MTAAEASALIQARKLSCEELARSCLARIASRDAGVKAWLHVDPDHVVRRARELDKRAPKGPLHGLPFGVKDVIDTADYPTTQNSPIYEGLRVGRDAAAVGVVRGSGGLILGKTDTVEFAAMGRMAATSNPFNPAHTPGGSSSGSGAAVGDFQVPLAFGTQTGGSLIRPASFNGIYALKPTWARVSREGLRMSSVTLDTIGWYGRCVEDLALVAEAFRIRREPAAIAVKGLRVGLCRSPVWREIEPAGELALMTAARRLAEAGAIVTELELPEPFSGLHAAQHTIVEGEGAVAFLPEYVTAPDLLTKRIRDRVENAVPDIGQKLLAAYTLADSCRPVFDRLFGPELDIVLTPSSKGEAPEGLHTGGNPIFNRMWTLLHVPTLGIPVCFGPQGLPVGITLVGPRMGDSRLLAIAEACAPVIDPDPGERMKRLWPGAVTP